MRGTGDRAFPVVNHIKMVSHFEPGWGQQTIPQPPWYNFARGVEVVGLGYRNNVHYSQKFNHSDSGSAEGILSS